MTMGNVRKQMLEPLAVLYGAPPNDHPAVIGTYESVLGAFSDEVLAQGYVRLAGTFVPARQKPWPSPAECRKACEFVAPDAAPALDNSSFLVGLTRRRNDSRLWAAEWLRQTDQGRAAVEHGFGREAAHIAAQIHYQLARDGRQVGYADVKIDHQQFDDIWRTYGRRQMAAAS
jgi:hypothetical protein